MATPQPGEQRFTGRFIQPGRLLSRIGALAVATGLAVAALPLTGAADAEVIQNSDGTTSTQLDGDFYLNSDGTAGYRFGDRINNSDGTITLVRGDRGVRGA